MRKLLVGVVIGVVIGTAVGGTSAQESSMRGTFVVGALSTGTVKGNVAILGRPRSLRAQSIVSLHGLTPATRYRAAAVDSRCRRTTRASAAGAVSADIMGTQDAGAADDLIAVRNLRLDAPLRLTRSVRVYALGADGTPAQVACIPVRRLTG